MHAVAVVFDFVKPLVAVRRFVDELRQLRPYPIGQGGFRRCGFVPLQFSTSFGARIAAIGSISDGSLFLTLPIRGLTGQHQSVTKLSLVRDDESLNIQRLSRTEASARPRGFSA